MKSILIVVLMATSLPVMADNYTGIVAGTKHFRNGGIVVDLDAKFPNEKMQLYVPPEDAGAIGAIPVVGTKVTATGDIASYHGRPEIKIHQATQWHWQGGP